MAEMQKKMAAALAAVNAYLQQEEITATISATPATAPLSAHGTPPNLWGQCSRQEMMTMRRLIQMRAFERCR